ncbi:unannotated protein [freshwater metagenome]|uniref:Unannotated protein n=1 Tax=freshwater metagenome TaxID=449393 RepID=A0A6J7KV25_9ZZZZ
MLRVCLERQHHLALVGDHTLCQRHPAWGRATSGESAYGRLWPRDTFDPAPREVGCIGDRSSCAGHLAQHLLVVARPQHRGHSSLVVDDETIRPPAVHPVESISNIKQHSVGLEKGCVRNVSEPRRGHRAQHHDVAKSAVALLQVRLEQVGEVTSSVGPRL